MWFFAIRPLWRRRQHGKMVLIITIVLFFTSTANASEFFCFDSTVRYRH